MAEYVIREHHRGRSLADILDDPYVTNRLSPEQVAAAARPAGHRARGRRRHRRRAAHAAAQSSRPTPRSRASSTTRAPTARSHAAIPFDLKSDDVLGGRAALQLAGDDLLQLVHLEPVEDAALDRLDQVARLELRLLERVAADERRALEHGVVELAPRRVVRADRADERAVAQPLAAQHRVLRGGHRDDDVLLGRLAVRLGRLAVVLAAERARAAPRCGSRRRPARSPAPRRGCTRPATPPASRSRSRRASPRPAARGGAPRRPRPRPCAAGRACRPRSPPRAARARARRAATRNGVPSRIHAYDLSARVAELAVDARHHRELPVRRAAAARAAGCRPRRARAARNDSSTASSASAGVSSSATSCSVR